MVAEPVEPDWVTLEEAARRLGMSGTWFAHLAKPAGITVVRRGSRPGVDWQSVEQWIGRSRIDAGTISEHPQRMDYSMPRRTENLG